MSDNDPNNKKGPSKIDSFLKSSKNVNLQDLENQDPNKNKEFIHKKLFEKQREPILDAETKEALRSIASKLKKKFAFYRKRSFKDNAPMAIFMAFSCYILYKMEDRLDGMRRKIVVQKSIKEMEIERENELIKQALEDHPFTDNVQISDAEFENRYKYQDDEDEDDDEVGVISTKADIYRYKDDSKEQPLDRTEEEEIKQMLKDGKLNMPAMNPAFNPTVTAKRGDTRSF